MALGQGYSIVVHIAAKDKKIVVQNPVDIGVSTVPQSAYYLVAVEPEISDEFEVKPAPGTLQTQHRAKNGYEAIWRYEVKPLKLKAKRLVFTIRTFQENDTAGTAVVSSPVEVKVYMSFPKSYWVVGKKLVTENYPWISSVIATLGGLEWFRRKRRNKRRSASN